MIVIALVKVIYNDGETIITAANMNEIQDEIIANQQAIEELQTQVTGIDIVPASVE